MMKKALIVVLAALMLVTVIGCGVVGDSGTDAWGNVLNTEAEFPQYADNGSSFRLAVYFPPTDYLRTDKHYAEMADANINFVFGDEQTHLGRVSELDLCAKYGMQYMLYDKNIQELIRQDRAGANEIRALLDMIELYAGHSAFAGVHLIDEPNYSNLPTIKLFTDAIWEKYPGIEINVNMHPIWQSQPVYVGPHGYEACIDAIYEVAPGILSYDNYPLYKGDSNSPPYIGSTNTRNLEVIATKAKQYGVPFYNFLQTIEAYGFTISRASDNYEEIAWQFNCDIAYGINGIMTFTYRQVGELAIKAMLRKDGTLTETYHAFKEYTDELMKWDYVYEKFSWEGTMLYKKAGTFLDDFDTVTTARKTHPRIKSVTNTQHTMIGTFLDGEERDGFFVVNYLDPYYKLTNEVTIELNDAKYALIYERGKRRVVETDAGKLKFKLEGGDAAFVIPFN